MTAAEETTAEPVPFPTPGVYMHMDEVTYHSIPGFSKSLVKKFMVSDADAWESIYGEGNEATKAMDYGSALHALILEGRENFDKRFCKAFDKSEHPGALDTVEDLKKWLKVNGLAVSGNKGELIQRICEIDSSVPILELLKEEHERFSSHKTTISAEDYDEIVSREWIRKILFVPDTQAETEVSFFWHDEKLGVPCKARLDCVSFAGEKARVGDLKSFSNFRENEIRQCVAMEIGYRKYHIDGLFYTRALMECPRVFHETANVPDWPVVSDPDFLLLFVESGKRFPNVIPRELILRQGGSLTELGQAAFAHIQDAANRYRDLHAEHGSKPWNRPHAHDYISESDLPLHLL